MSITKTQPRRAEPKSTRSYPTLRVLYTGELGRVVQPARKLSAGELTLGRSAEHADWALEHDGRISRQHARVIAKRSSAGAWTVTVQDAGSSNGTQLCGRRISTAPEVLNPGDVLRLGDTLLHFRLTFEDERQLDEPLHSMLGISPEIGQLRHAIKLFAGADVSVVLLGETGTGKEVAARALHIESGRSGPFVAVNCSTIPEALAESQLFGHMRGAFTGATHNHDGYFRAADGGTLFLDELGDLPAAVQPKLLRVLETRTVTPMGGAQSLAFDTRIVCATESRIGEAVANDAFRGALYARLRDISVELPPLRQRREDILLLADHFLDAPELQLEPDLAEALVLHDWPFNVRELSKLMLALKLRGAQQNPLTYDLIAHRLPAPSHQSSAPQNTNTDTSQQQDTSAPTVVSPPPSTREEMQALMQRHQGNISGIARETGRSRRQVYRWIEKFGLDAQD